MQSEMNIVLPGLISIDPTEIFEVEYSKFPQEYKKELRRWLKIRPVKNTLQDPTDSLIYNVIFEPMKPLKFVFDMIFFKKTGGRWK